MLKLRFILRIEMLYEEVRCDLLTFFDQLLRKQWFLQFFLLKALIKNISLRYTTSLVL